MSGPSPIPSRDFDVFLSYSRRYVDFAEDLARSLEKFRPPRDLGVPQRNLRVFRDQEDITGSEYHGAIDKYLAASGVLVVLCSPAARASPYVDGEIRRFAELRSSERIVPVLVDGLPNNETLPENADEAAFPDALMDVMDMPLAIDFRGFEPGRSKVHGSEYSNAWYTLLANVYDVERREIEARDLKRARRRRRQMRALAGAVMAVLAGFAAYAWTQKIESDFQAFSAELARNEALASGEVALVRQRQAEAQADTADQERIRAVAAESLAVAEERRATEARREAESALVRAQQARLGGLFGTRFAQGRRLAAFRALDTLSREWGGQPDLTRLDPDSLRDMFVTVSRGLPDGSASPAEILDVVRYAHPTFVEHPEVYGIMSHLLWDLAARHPELAQEALATLEPMRRAFAASRPAAAAPEEGAPDDDAVVIPAGTVAMGPDGTRRVTVPTFRLQRYEVTHAEYARFDPDHVVPPGREHVPVTGVNWYQAAAYAAWRGGALPTEAQWERAARGEEGRRFPWGNAPEPGASCDRAVFVECSGRRAAVVGSAALGATPAGVEDLAGNAWEWVGDWWDGSGPGGDDDESGPRGPLPPNGPESGIHRLLRGGSFHLGPSWMRAWVRHHDLPDRAYDDYGFRVAWPGGDS